MVSSLDGIRHRRLSKKYAPVVELAYTFGLSPNAIRIERSNRSWSTQASVAQLADAIGSNPIFRKKLWVRLPPLASKVVKGSPQNLDKGETIYPHPPLMTDAPENTITFGNSILNISVDWFRIVVRDDFPAVGG